MLPPRLRESLQKALGSTIAQVHSVAGGDIHQAFRMQLTSGQSVFVKTSARALPRVFQLEARGLQWLADTHALRIPHVLAVSAESEEGAYLALEWIEPSAPARNYDEQLGRGLATLHRTGAQRFGLEHHNYLATLAQDNTPSDAWPSFYAQRRLQPLLALAVERGAASTRMRQGFARVLGRIDTLCGPAEPPARVHGDLWSGNVLVGAVGEPVLIDPAVYGGHREIDLAMMRLFGGFSERCFAAYDEAFPLAAGHEERVALYQLYPLLAHVVLFGRGYVTQVERALAALV